jgi:hypothetical protein
MFKVGDLVTPIENWECFEVGKAYKIVAIQNNGEVWQQQWLGIVCNYGTNTAISNGKVNWGSRQFRLVKPKRNLPSWF